MLRREKNSIFLSKSLPNGFLTFLHKGVSSYLILLFSVTAYANDKKTLFDLSLEELLSLEMTSGSLTSTNLKLSPASATLINEKDIVDTGARSIDELLDILVPNLQVIRHNYGPNHIGIRGLMKSVDTHYLYRVNGKVLNQRGHLGAITERDLPMLGDIKTIEIIRGAGSSVYGPGAISGIINITTKTGLDFDGTDVDVKLGAIEEFSTLEIRHGRELSWGPKLFTSFGISEYRGASSANSPHIVSVDSTFNGQPYLENGESVPYEIPRDNAAHRGLPKYKLHSQLNGEDWNAWLRYTAGGTEIPGEHPKEGDEGPRTNQRTYTQGYRQLTLAFEKKQNLSESKELNYTLSYDVLDWERVHTKKKSGVDDAQNRRDRAYLEEHLDGKLSVKNTGENTQTVMGLEASYGVTGKKGYGFPNIEATREGFTNGNRVQPDEEMAKGKWGAYSYAGFGEIQWQISEKWLTFLGIRFDKHQFTRWYTSPNIALIYSQNNDQIWKILLNQSVKRPDEITLKEANRLGGSAKEERIQSLELSYVDTQMNNILFNGSLFVEELQFFSFNVAAGKSKPTGDMKLYGVELEMTIDRPSYELSFSHSFTKLISLDNSEDGQDVTAEPYGFGNDLNNWSNNITKLFYRLQINETWRFTSSARIYWGFAGAKDWAEYNNSLGGESKDRYGKENDDAFKGNYYVNFGFQKELSKHTTIRFDAYNILGWADKKLNKRNYIKRVSDYRPQAAAFAIGIKYSF